MSPSLTVNTEGFRMESLSSVKEIQKAVASTPAGDSQDLMGYVRDLLIDAVKRGASDLHIEPQEDGVRIRQRVNGSFVQAAWLDPHLYPAVLSGIKEMNGADIAEFRIPQDGRMTLGVADRSVDVRMSTLPTRFGESVVLRFLDRMRVGLTIDTLGITESELGKIRSALSQPSGIFLATGPTGSGKTTTLYCALQEINCPGLKILTVEDPVEYALEGILQVPVNVSIGLDFSSVLRAFLRHDPDVMLIGEIRDEETASIGIHAAMTGHRVLSSLHTQDTASAVVRMVDMGIEPFLLAETLSGVVGQRLLRRIPGHLKEYYEASEEERAALGTEEDHGPVVICRKAPLIGASSVETRHHSFPERIAIFEVMIPNDAIRECMINKSPGQMIRSMALNNGMTCLRDHARKLVLEGEIEFSEMILQTV